MTEDLQQHPLYPIINPKSIAFFGASNRFSSMGTNQLHSVLSLGFAGAIYPVHPKEEQVLGLKAYPDVMDLPEVPDLAVMVLPTPDRSGSPGKMRPQGDQAGRDRLRRF